MSDEISTARAPRAIGPYAQARVSNGLLFTSGQLPLCAETGAMIEGPVGMLAKQCLANLAAIAEAAGSSLDKAIKLSIFLRDMRDGAEVHEAYAAFFAAPYPARTTVQVAGLPMDARIEIEAVIAL